MRNIVYKKYIWFFSIVLVSIALDQIAKHYVRELITTKKCIRVCEILNLVGTYNTGISWGLFSKFGKMMKWFFLSLSAGLVVIFLRMFWKEKRRSTQLAIGFIVGGACGNMYDRIQFGGVFDFLSVHWGHVYFPVFNIADILISVGFAALVRDYYRWNR